MRLFQLFKNLRFEIDEFCGLAATGALDLAGFAEGRCQPGKANASAVRTA
jgi:hypothetical protein